jgi:hypothetical protein
VDADRLWAHGLQFRVMSKEIGHLGVARHCRATRDDACSPDRNS